MIDEERRQMLMGLIEDGGEAAELAVGDLFLEGERDAGVDGCGWLAAAARDAPGAAAVDVSANGERRS